MNRISCSNPALLPREAIRFVLARVAKQLTTQAPRSAAIHVTFDTDPRIRWRFGKAWIHVELPNHLPCELYAQTVTSHAACLAGPFTDWVGFVWDRRSRRLPAERRNFVADGVRRFETDGEGQILLRAVLLGVEHNRITRETEAALRKPINDADTDLDARWRRASAALKKWNTRLKLARTKVQGYQNQTNRLARRIEARMAARH